MSKKWINSPRGLALIILEEVFYEGAYSNLVLNKYLKSSQMSEQDKHLVTELVYGTLSRKLTLEWQLSHFIVDRDKLDNWVYTLLLISLYQVIYLDKVPNHAIVNEAVKLAKLKSVSASKFVNGFLRQILRSDLPNPESIKRVNKRYAIKYSLPVWLVKKIIEEYGEQRAVKIFESLFIRSKASIRVVDANDYDMVKEATSSKKSKISELGLVKNQGNFAATTLFKEGKITIQDESSQLVAPVMSIQGEENILDACAAPGGKTVHMASYLTTGQITALDLYDHKLSLIKENAERLNVSDKVVTKKMDATQVHQYFEADTFDKILVDAPCSGIGLVRRKPDIKYNKSNSDFEKLQNIQLEILASVCQTVKKGGIIVYSTCTIVSEENFQVIEKFLESHPDFEQVPISHSNADIVKDGCILITPELYETDGFFISKLQRKA